MPPRKKLKTSNQNLQKCNTILHTKNSEVIKTEENTACNFDDVETRFSVLPSEVLSYILDYLSPVDLLSMSEIGDERIKNLTYTERYNSANFSSCRRAKPDRISSFFTKDRVAIIKELNFNNNVYVKPHILARLICRCKHLSVLSAINSGLNYSQMIQVLQTCTELKKLSWDVNGIVNVQNAPLSFKSATEELYLCIKLNEIRYIYNFLAHFQDAKKMWINFSLNALAAQPLIGNWLNTSVVYNHDCSKKVILLLNSFQHLRVEKLQQLSLRGQSPSRVPYIVLPDKSVESVLTKFQLPPFLKILSNNADVTELSSASYKSEFSSLILNFTPNIIELDDKLAELIIKVCEKSLKNVALHHDAMNGHEIGKPMPISSQESLAICNTLDKIFFSCHYITTITLVTMHFPHDLPCNSIRNLKNLKTLCIPTCAFYRNDSVVPGQSSSCNSTNKVKVDCITNGLEDLAANCLHMAHLTIYGCPDHRKLFSDEDLYPIKNFKKLKTFEITSLKLRSCSFLRKMSCLQLCSISLISIMESAGGLYIPDLICLLKKSKDLKFLRINEDNFSPIFERFWETVGTVENLEGICIVTKSQRFVNASLIIPAIRQLKYLNLFHFYSVYTPDSLYVNVKKAMQMNKIAVNRIERDLYINSYCSVRRSHYYHEEPYFSCQHFHCQQFTL